MLQKTDAGGGDTAKPKDQIFGTLRIEKRVLVTPARTIAIANISQVAAGSYVTPGRKIGFGDVIWISALMTFLAIMIGSAFRMEPPTIGAIAVAFTLIASAIYSGHIYKPETETHRLAISTNDGSVTYFTGSSRETIEEVRRLLGDKINADDHTSTYTINFETGTIDNVNITTVGQMSGGAVVQGEGNETAVNSPGARIATADTTMTVTNSPGAQVGYGHAASGNTATLTRIDFGTAAETLAEWRAYYEQHAEGRELAAKLAEAEALVRSGTPSPGERSRLRDVILDLSQILQGFPPAVQLFRSILGLVA